MNKELKQRSAARTKALADGERRLCAILDAAVDAIVTIDQDGNIETFNRAAERMFGYRSDEAIGRNIAMMMASPYREQHDGYLRRYLRTGERRVIDRIREFRARRKDGSEFPIQLSVSEVPDLGLFTGIVRDMSEQRELQENMERAATAERHRLGAELHDTTLQELAGIGLLAQNLVDMLESPRKDPERELASKIASGIAKTNRQVRRLANGLVPVPVDAEGLMSALAKLTQRTQDEYDLSCTFFCPEPVPINGDSLADHLYRIAQEALTNAVKHSKADSISVRLERRDAMLELEIRDNGIGIEPDSREQGGLGLRIMEHRCGLMGGTFTVRRCKLDGTVVSCQLPSRMEN